MQKRAVAQWVFNVLVLGVLAGAFAGVVWLFALALREGATIVAGSLAAFGTVFAAVIVRYFERRKEIEAVRRDRLGSSYEALASALAGHDMTQRKREKVILVRTPCGTSRSSRRCDET